MRDPASAAHRQGGRRRDKDRETEGDEETKGGAVMPGAFARTPLTSCGAVRYGLETQQLAPTQTVCVRARVWC